MDKLTKMMEMQEHLNTNVINKLEMEHYLPPSLKEGESISTMMTSDEYDNHIRLKREWADNFMSALQAEVVETREALTQRVKWWKDKTKTDEGVKEEIIDCWHFLMSASLAMGMTADEIFQIYCKKNEANFTRKDWDVNQ